MATSRRYTTMLAMHVVCCTAAAAHPDGSTFSLHPPDAQRLPYLGGVSESVRLNLDAERYRSSSQGPMMQEELTPKDMAATVEEIDNVIDHYTLTHGYRPVIPQYAGSRSWAWQQWRGTILERLWPTCLLNMLVPALLILSVKLIDPDTSVWQVPDEGHFVLAFLSTVTHGWNYLLTLTTFVTTFFVGHSHDFWRKCYGLSRVVQGRINDIGLLCATHAARDANGETLEKSQQCLLDMARYLRLAHMLFWADVCYRRTIDRSSVRSLLDACMHVCMSARARARARMHAHAQVRSLLSPAGLDRLMTRGLLAQREHATLLSANLPAARW